MPGQGRIVGYDYSADNRARHYLGLQARRSSGTRKWLSYRERDALGRALSLEEVLYFAEMARRVEDCCR